MKGFVIGVVLLLLSIRAQNAGGLPQRLHPGNKLFIITLDGFRWEELFGGADSALINDAKLNP